MKLRLTYLTSHTLVGVKSSFTPRSAWPQSLYFLVSALGWSPHWLGAERSLLGLWMCLNLPTAFMDRGLSTEPSKVFIHTSEAWLLARWEIFLPWVFFPQSQLVWPLSPCIAVQYLAPKLSFPASSPSLVPALLHGKEASKFRPTLPWSPSFLGRGLWVTVGAWQGHISLHFLSGKGELELLSWWQNLISKKGLAVPEDLQQWLLDRAGNSTILSQWQGGAAAGCGLF